MLIASYKIKPGSFSLCYSLKDRKNKELQDPKEELEKIQVPQDGGIRAEIQYAYKNDLRE